MAKELFPKVHIFCNNEDKRRFLNRGVFVNHLGVESLLVTNGSAMVFYPIETLKVMVETDLTNQFITYDALKMLGGMDVKDITFAEEGIIYVDKLKRRQTIEWEGTILHDAETEYERNGEIKKSKANKIYGRDFEEIGIFPNWKSVLPDENVFKESSLNVCAWRGKFIADMLELRRPGCSIDDVILKCWLWRDLYITRWEVQKSSWGSDKIINPVVYLMPMESIDAE